MLAIETLTTTYGDLTAVDDVSLTVEPGELFCLLGPSGSGKSTVLRTVAGFESPASGRVRLDGVDVTDAPPNERDCSMVFQDWALFPRQTVAENVAFGLRMAGVGATDRRERAREMLELVEMAGYADATPAELSGGQKQRVALARSLAVDPDLLLLDEPLSNLDRKLRETMQLELADIQRRLGTTMLYVTHDQDEAFTLADRLGVMNGGELVQVGDPATVYDEPRNRFVESFLGSTNFLDCRVAAGPDGPVLETPLGVAFEPALDDAALAEGDRVTVSLRPERLTVSGVTDEPAVEVDGGPEGGVAVTGTVTETVYRGSDSRVAVSAGDASLFVELGVATAPSVAAGDRLRVRFDPADAVYFDAEGDRCR